VGSETNLATNLKPTPIVLCTLNARYIHSAFGLRYLQANLGDFKDQCVIEEFTLESRAEDIVEKLLLHDPKVVGFGVYIWNIDQTEKVVALLKAVAPDVVIVLGGPEVSHEISGQSIVGFADYVITGWGEKSFSLLIEQLLCNDSDGDGDGSNYRAGRTSTQEAVVIAGEQPKLDQITMPYELYSDEDIKNRILYVEASRGCPFKCEFCLSALDKTAWPFDLDLFLSEMDVLYKRGARHFKFVDRTFNLKIKSSLRILQFFLERMDDDLFLHFEVIPDHLPEALKEMILRFPVGVLQFEIGIQTFNPEVQTLISRRQDNDKVQENLKWITQNTNAYVHADLIFGLPSETVESFGKSFNQLVELAPHEIQVGILKRLKGSPIVRHTQAHKLVFNPNSPFSIVSSDTVNYQAVQAVNRFARYWDLIGNSGRFKACRELILADEPYARFDRLSRALFERTGQTHKISLLRLYDLVFDIGVEVLGIDPSALRLCIETDFDKSGLKSIPRCLVENRKITKSESTLRNKQRHNSRQSRH
jgi:radical SAM superfamily enzyme YgiQ (UPF0313 family)